MTISIGQLFVLCFLWGCIGFTVGGLAVLCWHFHMEDKNGARRTVEDDELPPEPKIKLPIDYLTGHERF